MTLQNTLQNAFSAHKASHCKRSLRDWLACHPIQALTAHKLKMADQIAPKAGSGGFHAGCLSAKYHASNTVNHEPMPATAKLTTKATSKLRQWV